jgi:hypothetical protein
VTNYGTHIQSLPAHTNPPPKLANHSDSPLLLPTFRRSLAMDARPTPVTARFLRTPDAAVHLGLSARTLEKHRCFGTGPVYRKLGGRIVYAVADLDAWAEQGLRRSTSDPGKGIVHPAKRLDGYTPPVRR